MTLTFVHDPSVESILGKDLTEDIHRAVQPTGDCNSCQQPLGTDRPLRLDVSANQVNGMAYARHASCPPLPTDSPALLVPPSTFRINDARISMVRNGRTVAVAMALINPNVDVFTLIRPGQNQPFRRLLDSFRNLGFTDFDSVIVGGRAPSAREVSWVSRGTDMVFDLYGLDVVLTDPQPDFLAAVREQGGFLVMVSYRWWIGDLAEDPSLFGSVLQDPHGAAFAWLPA